MALSHIAFARFLIRSFFWFQNISGARWPLGSGFLGGGSVQRGDTEGWGGCGLAHIRRISCAYRAHKGELAQAPWNRGLKGFQKHALSRRLCSPTHEVSKDAAHSGQHDPRAYLEHTARNIPGTEHALWFRNTSGTYRKKWTCAVHG